MFELAADSVHQLVEPLQRVHNTEEEGLNLTSMLEFKVLISKGLTINRFSSHSIAMGEITSLEHKAWDDPMEGAPLVM